MIGSTDVLRTVLPGGKYHCISRCLNDQASAPPVCPETDLICMFDNKQFIGRSWNIRPRKKVKVSVVTTITAVPLNNKTEVQSKMQLHPKK